MKRLTAALFTLLLSAWGLSAAPFGSAFTYQGRLADGGVPASGLYEFQFQLFATPADGSVLGTVSIEPWPVTNGVFTVPLDFGASAFNGGPRYLQVWTKRATGTNDFVLLAPRVPLTPAPYALLSGGVVDGAITGVQIADGAVTAGKLAPGAVNPAQLATNAVTTIALADGSVTTPKLADNAVATAKIQDASVTAPKLAPGAAVANLAASGLSGVPSGAIIMSDQEGNSNFLAAGYVSYGLTMPLNGDTWTNIPPGPPATGALSPGRSGHKAVWSGADVYIVGGTPDSTPLRYNPAANNWVALSKSNAPARLDSNNAN